MPDGGTLSIISQRDNGFLSIKFIDTGVGIPSEDVPRIFERFYRVDKARSRELGGTGLGLHISKAIIDKHGGHIDYETKLGQGTRFFFELPKWREQRAALG
mgnify:CR=1 FL=1